MATTGYTTGTGERSTRCERGVALFLERGDEIVAYLDGSFGVPSRKEEDVIYHVNTEAGTCQCADYVLETVHRNNPDHVCLHIYAAELKRVERAIGRRGRTTPCQRSRCDQRSAA